MTTPDESAMTARGIHRRNIALVLAVSKYRTEADLPPVEIDKTNVLTFLTALKRYDDILVADGELPAADLKRVLRDWASRNKTGEKIGELFVDLSGHGIQIDEPLFCLTDYSDGSRRATCLANSELDDIARSLSPDLYVKVVDACYSGNRYVKRPREELTIVQREAFDKVMAWYSSHPEQPSIALGVGSVFTNAFLYGALQQAREVGNNIYYNSIIPEILDRMEQGQSYEQQQPLFVSQVHGNERLGVATDELLEFKAQFMSNQLFLAVPANSDKDILQVERSNLEDAVAVIVKREDDLYVTEEVASSILGAVESSITGHVISDALVGRFYGIEVLAERTGFDDPLLVGWADRYNGPDRLLVYVSAKEEERTVEVPAATDRWMAALGVGHVGRTQAVTRKHRIATEFYVSANLPFTRLSVRYATESVYLKKRELSFVFVPTPRSVFIHRRTSESEVRGWRDVAFSPRGSWQVEEILWRSLEVDPSAWWRPHLRAEEQHLHDILTGIAESRGDDTMQAGEHE